MSSNNPFLFFDDTNPNLEYSDKQWFDNTIDGAFNNSLSSTTSVGATVQFTFEASEIVIIGATVAPPHALANDGPLSSYILDNSRNSATVFRANVANKTNVVFFTASGLSSGSHTLTITIEDISDGIPYLLDAVALQSPQTYTSTSTNVWVTTVFATASSAATANVQVATSSTNSLPVGAIVGGVVGGVALLVVSALAFYFLFWRRRHYGYNSFSGAALFDAGEKDHLGRPLSGSAPSAYDRSSQVQPFLPPGPDTPMRPYSDLTYGDPASPPPPSRAVSAYYSAPAAGLAGATAAAPGYTPGGRALSFTPSLAPSLAPHTYPPPGPGSVSSGSGAGAGTARTLSVVNDTGDVAALAAVGATAAVVAAAALTPAERKAQEAAREAADARARHPEDFPSSSSAAAAAAAMAAGDFKPGGGAKLDDKDEDEGGAKLEGGSGAKVQYHADSGVRFDVDGQPVDAEGRPVDAHLVDVPPEYTEI